MTCAQGILPARDLGFSDFARSLIVMLWALGVYQSGLGFLNSTRTGFELIKAHMGCGGRARDRPAEKQHGAGCQHDSAIYKQRWQIKLFFKAIIQKLKIKTFAGISASAVQIQIGTALSAILLLKYLQMSRRLGQNL